MSDIRVRKLKTLDILTSALDEAESLPILYERICSTLEGFSSLEWKLHVVDNGSIDETWEVLKRLASIDKRVVGYRMSRTFLFDSAITATLDGADAEAIVIMCSDLQDPPELIPKMIDKYEEGYDQVCAQIKSRKSVPFFVRILTRVFYRFANVLSRGELPENVSDFRLASKACYEAAKQLRENNRFIRGQFAWVGFRTYFLELERPNRIAGKSKFLQYPKLDSIWLGVRAVFSHSALPLISVAGLGIFSSIVSIVITAIFSISWITFGVPFAGYGTIIGIIMSGFSLVLLGIGIIALYIASIYEEVKKRPLYIISESTDKAL